MRLSILLAFALGLTGPATIASAADTVVRTAPGLSLPASFEGELPMASGPGAQWQLDLWPDQTFHLTQRFGTEAEPMSDIGRWSADPARDAIVLRGGREAPVYLQILGDGHLRLMDLRGEPIDSELNYTLTPGPLDPAEVTLPLTGSFTYLADAALFEECLTGRAYPVAMEQDYISAERAYTRSDVAPGSPAFVVLEGQLAARPAMEGPDRTHLVIERFDRLDPDGACPSPETDIALTNTYWRITEIGGAALPWQDGAQEPFLLLDDGIEPRFYATVGCNRMRGGVTLGDAEISFGAAAMTMMACPPPLDTMERDLTEALTSVSAWDMTDGGLTLQGTDGDTLLRAEAVYTR